MNLEELRVYNLAMEFGESIWDICVKWDYFAKDTIGKQLVKSSDSIAANISEGFGRYSFKENIHFCYFSRGSLFESKIWIEKAYRRKLIDRSTYDNLIEALTIIGKTLNKYINSIGKIPGRIEEPEQSYSLENDNPKIWANDNVLYC